MKCFCCLTTAGLVTKRLRWSERMLVALQLRLPVALVDRLVVMHAYQGNLDFSCTCCTDTAWCPQPTTMLEPTTADFTLYYTRMCQARWPNCRFSFWTTPCACWERPTSLTPKVSPSPEQPAREEGGGVDTGVQWLSTLHLLLVAPITSVCGLSDDITQARINLHVYL